MCVYKACCKHDPSWTRSPQSFDQNDNRPSERKRRARGTTSRAHQNSKWMYSRSLCVYERAEFHSIKARLITWADPHPISHPISHWSRNKRQLLLGGSKETRRKQGELGRGAKNYALGQNKPNASYNYANIPRFWSTPGKPGEMTRW